VLYRDADFLVVDKPCNVFMDGPGSLTMARLMAERFPRASGQEPWHHCHQLDYATSGVLWYASSAHAAARRVRDMLDRGDELPPDDRAADSRSVRELVETVRRGVERRSRATR
jgi:23S rRNA-/tRNA-specific pseudouridylate synthase